MESHSLFISLYWRRAIWTFFKISLLCSTECNSCLEKHKGEKIIADQSFLVLMWMCFWPEIVSQPRSPRIKHALPRAWPLEQRSWSWKQQQRWRPACCDRNENRSLWVQVRCSLGASDQKRKAEIWLNLCCREIITQSHVKSERAHAGYHHHDWSYAHRQALNTAGPLQYPPLFWSDLWRHKQRSRQRSKRTVFCQGLRLTNCPGLSCINCLDKSSFPFVNLWPHNTLLCDRKMYNNNTKNIKNYTQLIQITGLISVQNISIFYFFRIEWNILKHFIDELFC